MKDAYGLVIGIAGYKNINPLPPIVIADARDIHGLLVDPSHCAYPTQNVRLLLDNEATHEEVCEATVDLSRCCHENSTVFFYISGHGARIASGPHAGEYLLLVDSLPVSHRSFARRAISGAAFTEMLRSIPARKVVVVLDTCYAGGVGELKAASSEAVEPLPESFYRALVTGRGRIILASSLRHETSHVSLADANSVFTKYLLAGLRGGAPGPGGVIRIFDLFHYLQPRVVKEQPQQHPLIKAEVEENFPVALYLGGKDIDSVTDQAAAATWDGSSGKAGRILHQLDRLLGIDQRLSEHDRGVLFAALSFVPGADAGGKAVKAHSAAQPAAQPAVTEEAREVIDRGCCELETEVRPYKYRQTELLSALLRIGLRLDLRREAMNSQEPGGANRWSLENWLAYLTKEIICERGVLSFHLVAPAENWIEPLIGATAVAMESLWQHLRSVLTQNNLSFAVSRPRLEIDDRLSSAPSRVLKKIREAAQNAKDAWPKSPHLAEGLDLPRLEDLLPLPQSTIRSAAFFPELNRFPVRLRVNDVVVAQAGAESPGIEFWPPVEGLVDCVLESNQGGVFLPVVRSHLRKLYAMEAEFVAASSNPARAYRLLGLNNDLLRLLWPSITGGTASALELAEALHLLRDACDEYDRLSLADASFLVRRDMYWDAIGTIRQQLIKEEGV